jgi:arabinose-5-phosphate isomerase
VQLVIGDAIAAVMIKLHDFKPDDFAMFHPSGSLGKRLLLKVSDMMHGGDETPLVKSNTKLRDALVVMTVKAMGAILVVDDNLILQGIMTDGDLRRAIQKYDNVMEKSVDQLMTHDPVCCHPQDKAIDAIHLMEKRSSQISVVPVVDEDNRAVGILRLHDLVISGI